jgi:hypothetical protein
MLGIFDTGSHFFLPRLASKLDPPDLCLQSSFDYRGEPLAPDLNLILDYLHKIPFLKPGVVVHSYNPSTQEGEAGRSSTSSKLAWAKERLCLKKRKKENEKRFLYLVHFNDFISIGISSFCVSIHVFVHNILVIILSAFLHFPVSFIF